MNLIVYNRAWVESSRNIFLAVSSTFGWIMAWIIRSLSVTSMANIKIDQTYGGSSKDFWKPEERAIETDRTEASWIM